MPRKIRVLIIDGELLSRRLVGRAVEGIALFELIGTAGLDAGTVEKVGRLQPELILLGIGAKAAAGFELLTELRTRSRDVPIVIINPHARKGTPLTVEALSLGASGYVAYEETAADDATIAQLGAKLASEARRLILHDSHAKPADDKATVVMNAHSPARSAPPAKSSTFSISAPIEIVVIGVSTGGPNALAAIMPKFDEDFPVPIVIVQHLPENFSQPLAARLNALSGLIVREAQAGAEARPGTAWIAPNGVHLEVKQDVKGVRLTFSDGPEENMCKPAADVLFRSAARVFGSRVLGVVLTGMGFDGVAGSRDIRAAGGTVIVQDIPTSVIKGGMPGNVAEAGLADKVLPITELGQEIVRIARLGRTSPPSSEQKG